MIKVLLADDHQIVRAGLRALLQSASDIKVIGEAENGVQAVRAAEGLRPDVVVLDLAMARCNGIAAARHIARKLPTAKVLILSSYDDAEHVRQALEAGVAGYLIKQCAGNDLMAAIREIAGGGAYFSPPLLKHLLQHWLQQGLTPAERRIQTPDLSLRHSEVLQLMAEGYGTKQIAGLLFISQKTVEKHRCSLMKKLKMHKVAMVTRYAVSSGVIESNHLPGLTDAPVIRSRKRGKRR